MKEGSEWVVQSKDTFVWTNPKKVYKKDPRNYKQTM